MGAGRGVGATAVVAGMATLLLLLLLSGSSGVAGKCIGVVIQSAKNRRRKMIFKNWMDKHEWRN